MLDDGLTAPAGVKAMSGNVLRITIHEGRNRQVRRMCEAVGHPVRRLIRIRIGPISDRRLAPGAWRALTTTEVRPRSAPLRRQTNGPLGAGRAGPLRGPLGPRLTDCSRERRFEPCEGATTLDADTPEQIHERVQALLTRMLERNNVDKEDLISMLFTATDDIHSMFPAAAARELGFGDVPLICAGTRHHHRYAVLRPDPRASRDVHSEKRTPPRVPRGCAGLTR